MFLILNTDKVIYDYAHSYTEETTMVNKRNKNILNVFPVRLLQGGTDNYQLDNTSGGWSVVEIDDKNLIKNNQNEPDYTLLKYKYIDGSFMKNPDYIDEDAEYERKQQEAMYNNKRAELSKIILDELIDKEMGIKDYISTDKTKLINEVKDLKQKLILKK